ncbi:MAG: helix-turn-helix domain-containing protein [Sphingomonadales bacterium]|nr:helix-turn-helix domain-containing protein [Sphingomonadales bacterium]
MIDVAVILLNDTYASTAIGPAEVFHSAGTLWNMLKGEPLDPRCRVTIASLDGKAVSSPYGVQMLPQTSIRSVNKADLVFVPSSGLDLEQQFARHAALFPWLRKMAARGAHVAGCCTGSAYLAEAGLLDGREATTHWATADDFAHRYPKVDWRPEKLITEDRRMLCSGGVYSSMDLSLYLVEKFCGHEVALQCAKALLINMPRPSQSGYAVLPLSRPHDDEKVRTAEAYMEKNYARDVSIEGLARKLNMSPRNFMRRFKNATGRLPGNYLQCVRVAVAKEMLEDGARSVRAVGAAVGYDDAAFFRNVFKRCTGMSPSEYRENFTGISCAHPHSAGPSPTPEYSVPKATHRAGADA